ncbi:MAG: hypothetical protein AUJ85_05070 [Elusimicrobia bacterium CG1_02_37_114]|nr:MAG: hypothetical protein AUJ85_05070 [Elusimicrobia bacterium CG1_02_37_114]PIV53309.1 MAG: type II secretion protein F [Elusimicrobia bacterium CG02_land_8_20_14_3_00_37_13]PIZ13350.1 MAG: type II secretion protein F [Elusimicrobia bacterium CG_4_10_14_0_8_um_filter_37_32]
MIKLLLCLLVFLMIFCVVYYFINLVMIKFMKKYGKNFIFASEQRVERNKLKTKFNWKSILAEKKLTLKFTSALTIFIISYLGTYRLLISLPFAILGFFLPDYISKYLLKKELEQFENQLTDGLILLANSLRAGASFPQAIELLANDSKPPLSEEFAKVTYEIRLGIPLIQALLNLKERVKSKELGMFVTAVSIGHETGGNIPELLIAISNTLRERNKIQGKIKALTSQGKMSGYIVGAMPFILIITLYLMDPGLIEPMFNTIIGQLMLVVVLIMITVGAILIRKIVDIDI